MLVWVDCEMTGLDTVNDTIIEICVLITTDKLELVEQKGFERVIHVPESRLEQMTEWPYKQHKASGLWDKVVSSKSTHASVEQELMEYLEKYVPRGEGVLCGNSVHMDRIFLMREFPKFIDYLFYRIIDVSSFKEVCKRQNPALFKQLPGKKGAHTAREDIIESIDEMKWYWNNWLKPENQTN